MTRQSGPFSLQNAIKVMLGFVVCSTCYADYWAYSEAYHKDPGIYVDLLQGRGHAPEQYRVGVLWIADFIARHAHVGLRHSMTLIDLVSAMIAVFMLLALLKRSRIYQSAGGLARDLGDAGLVVLIQYYLAWITWYQRPETLPTAAIIALFLLLLTVPLFSGSRMGATASVAGLLLLTVVLGTVRADVGFALNAGVLLSCWRWKSGFALPRAVVAVTCGVGILLSLGTQWWFMRVIYPHASYGSIALFQLWDNIRDVNSVLPFVLFLMPYGWMLYTVARERVGIEAPSAALLIGSLLYLPMWATVGRIQEVRIFLPFALALAPLVVLTGMDRFAGAGIASASKGTGSGL